MKFNLTFKQVDIIIEALVVERRYYQKELDTSNLKEYKSMLKEKIEQIESLIEIMKKEVI